MKVLARLNYLVLAILFLAAGVYAQNVNVTATGGTPNASYATVKAAFDAVNAGTHTGAITIDIAANVVEPANTSAVLNSTGAGAASYISVLIRPAADNVTVTGAGGNGSQCGGRGLIELNGADNVTIDGDNPNSPGVNRNLTLTNTCGTSNAVVLRVAISNLVNSANNLTFRNLNVAGNAVGRNTPANNNLNEPGNPTGFSYGIYAGGNASTTNAANPPNTINDATVYSGSATAANMTIENTAVINAGRAVTFSASTLTVFPNFLIRGNLIGNPNANELNQVYYTGIGVSGTNGGVVSENTVYVESYLNIVQQGILLGVGSVNTSGVVVERNFVRRAKGNNNRAAGNGIHVFTDFPNTVRNNFVTGVGNRASGVFVGLIGTYGIFLGRGPGHRVYHNTVYMTGDLGGTEPNISAALGINVGSGNNADVRNNILINKQTQSGASDPLASVNVALYLTDATQDSSFNLTLNNNIYVQGKAINSGIAQIGQNAGGANLYQAANFDPNSTAPAGNLRAYTSRLNIAGTNDNQSSVLDPLVVSETDLHLQPGSPAINAGANVGIFNDIDGQLRVNAPDIGADEFDGATPQTNDIAASGFVAPANNQIVAANANFTPSAQFINLGTAAQANVPVRYQILDAANAVVYNQTATIAAIAPNQIVTVNFPATTLANAGNYTIRITSELAGDQMAMNDTISGTIRVVAALTGTISVGAGEAFASLTNAGGLFEALNAAGASGTLVVNITSDLTTETGAVRLNQLPAGASLTIKPSGAPRTISGNAPVNTALIALNAADNVTIDGSLNGGTDRSLTVSMGGGGNIVIHLFAGANGAQNNTIKNLNIVRSSTSLGTYGIFSGGATPTTNGADNDNNRFQNNSIQGVTYGIASRGASAANKNTGTFIAQNVMTGTGANRIGRGGILVLFDDGAQITDNQIANISTDLFGDLFGIALGTDSFGSTTTTGSDVSNALIARNRINVVEQLTSSSAVGIFSAGAATGTNNIVNNVISGVKGNGGGIDLAAGIFVLGRAGGAQNVYFNSVSLTGTRSFTTNDGTEGSYALAVGGTNNALNIRNNVFSNTLSNNITTATAKNYAVGIGFTTFTNLTFDNNVLYSNGAQARFGLTGSLRTSVAAAVEYTDLAAFRAATNTNNNSLALDPRFVSANDLHIRTGVPTPVESHGVPIAEITTDFDGDARNATTPDIGADEGNFNGLAGSDAAATQIVAPQPNVTIVGGANSSQTPRAVFTNTGATVLTNVQVRFTTIGPGGYNYTDTQTIASLPVGASVTVAFAAAPAFTTAGNYTASARILTADGNPTNNFVNAVFGVILPLAGDYTIGAGGAFASLTNAGGIFDALNRQGASGNVVINIADDLLAETGAIALNEIAGGATVTIKPAGQPRRIRSTGAAVIKLNGADNVTIDGSLNGGTDRSLTIENTAGGAGVWIADGETAGGNNNTVKNCNIVGVGGGAGQGIVSSSTFQIGQSPNFPMTNNSIINNRIVGADNGIFIVGADPNFGAPSIDQNWTITDNQIGGAGQNEGLTFRGILIGNAQNFTVSRNRIGNVASLPSSSAIVSGIMIAGRINGGAVTRNEIRGVRHTNPLGFGSNGIYLNSISTDANLIVANNFISDVASYGFNGVNSNDNGYGIMIQQGGGYKIYFNSVLMNTNQTLPESITAAINVGFGVSLAEANALSSRAASGKREATDTENNAAPQVNAIDLRGNIFANTQTVGTRYAIYVDSPSGAAVFSDINYNDYFSSQHVGFLTAPRATLAEWQTATGRDQNSKAVDPQFVSATDLHLRRTSPLINAGTPVSGVTVDFDGQTRDAQPDIGADEFTPRGNVVGDFDGDNRTDLSVFRPSDGTWYFVQSANNVSNITRFGTNGDVPVPGDYDGDGRMDTAVFRPSNGTWYILQTSNGAVISRQFGLGTDKPVQADYDGDGRTDIAVFRNGIWYLLRSSDGNFAAVNYGQAGDVPVQGNYDGDGRADFAVYRDGIWFMLLSSTNASTAVQFGLGSDTPLVGDFDGDGKADQAVFRSSNGTWYILGSTRGFSAAQWGISTDIPVVGDYDADGKSDIAVWRPSDGVWYIVKSSDNALIFRQWGQSGDVPVPANYQAR